MLFFLFMGIKVLIFDYHIGERDVIALIYTYDRFFCVPYSFLCHNIFCYCISNLSIGYALIETYSHT